nr:PREDICTED: uncharacterized protein LOC106705679 isoform X2 [Latimeria chalumnae]|eukprot:XP_014351020.1 PREDICTED: uncharacterized protein LOC106705679 isoform X2 [Latimeria chalumnae]
MSMYVPAGSDSAVIESSISSLQSMPIGHCSSPSLTPWLAFAGNSGVMDSTVKERISLPLPLKNKNPSCKALMETTLPSEYDSVTKHSLHCCSQMLSATAKPQKRQLVDTAEKHKVKMMKRAHLDVCVVRRETIVPRVEPAKASCPVKKKDTALNKLLKGQPPSKKLQQPSAHFDGPCTVMDTNQIGLERRWYQIPLSSPRKHETGLFSKRFQSSLQEYRRQREIKKLRESKCSSCQSCLSPPVGSAGKFLAKSKEGRKLKLSETRHSDLSLSTKDGKSSAKALPKRLPPSKHRSAGLKESGINLSMLTGKSEPIAAKKARGVSGSRKSFKKPYRVLNLDLDSDSRRSCRSLQAELNDVDSPITMGGGDDSFPVDWSPPRIDFLFSKAPSAPNSPKLDKNMNKDDIDSQPLKELVQELEDKTDSDSTLLFEIRQVYIIKDTCDGPEAVHPQREEGWKSSFTTDPNRTERLTALYEITHTASLPCFPDKPVLKRVPSSNCLSRSSHDLSGSGESLVFDSEKEEEEHDDDAFAKLEDILMTLRNTDIGASKTHSVHIELSPVITPPRKEAIS